MAVLSASANLASNWHQMAATAKVGAEKPQGVLLARFPFSQQLPGRFSPWRIPQALLWKPDWYSFLRSAGQTATVNETRLVSFQRKHLGSSWRRPESAEGAEALIHSNGSDGLPDKAELCVFLAAGE